MHYKFITDALITSNAKDSKSNTTDKKTTSLYHILGLENFANGESVRAAYLRLTLMHHPDRGGLTEKFQEIGHAYYVLNNEERKKHYDKLLKEGNAQEYENYFAKTQYDFTDELIKKAEAADLNGSTVSGIYPAHSYSGVKTHFDKHAGQIGKEYYLVGKPILISEGQSILRSSIPNEEIINSFKNLDKIALLLHKEDALRYASVKYIGNFLLGEPCFFPACAKVKLIREIKRNDEFVTAYYNIEYREGLHADGFSRVAVLNANIEDIELLSAKLIVVKPASHWSVEKEYSPVDLSEAFQENNTKTFF